MARELHHTKTLGTVTAKEVAIIHPMKITTKITALFLAATFPCAAFADILGAKLPAAFQLENAVMLFPILLIGLIAVSDYSRRFRTLKAANSATADATCETHRLAA